MKHNIFDNTFSIQPSSLAIANMLNTFEIEEGRVYIRTFPYYNGRERVICIVVEPDYGESFGTKLADARVQRNKESGMLCIMFGQNKNSDNLFIQHVISDAIYNAPTKDSGVFTGESYNSRIFFPHDQHYACAEKVLELIKWFNNSIVPLS